MHYHLDPLGGIAGDMFAAAMLDVWPQWESALQASFAASGLSRFVTLTTRAHRDGALGGRRLHLALTPSAERTSHLRLREVRRRLQAAALDSAVRARALAIFGLLGEAESRVHGLDVEEVAFHELGGWDSIADIVAAAWLIERAGRASWSCASVPMGRGRVRSAHGMLPLPAPTTAILLQGFPLVDDGLDGERVTPTGAAILRHLRPSFGPRLEPCRLCGGGIGFGTRTLDQVSNVLRVLALEPANSGVHLGRVAVCRFEVDDQTAEDLAVALDRLRALEGVHDVLQLAVCGKKGRIGTQVQVILQPERIDTVVERCFAETTTLGVRWALCARAALARRTEVHRAGDRQVAVKLARRPDGTETVKAEMRDVALVGGGLAAREAVRRAVESPRGDNEIDCRGEGER